MYIALRKGSLTTKFEVSLSDCVDAAIDPLLAS